VKKLSDCRVLLVGDAKANLDILVEGLKPDYTLSVGLIAGCQSANALHPIKPTTTVRFPRHLFQYS
jgi:hypothetical protein